MTVRLFLLSVLTNVIRALCVHGCGEISILVLRHFIPDAPLLVSYLAGLVAGVALTELVALHRS